MNAAGYPVSVVFRARELREADWSLRRICELVQKETGHRPSLNTVSVWVDPVQAAKHAARHRARNRAIAAAGAGNGGRLGQGHHSTLYQEARARALVTTALMRATQVALVMDFDYPGQGWDIKRVREVVA